jgi:hypothetical protein
MLAESDEFLFGEHAVQKVTACNKLGGMGNLGDVHWRVLPLLEFNCVLLMTLRSGVQFAVPIPWRASQSFAKRIVEVRQGLDSMTVSSSIHLFAFWLAETRTAK